MGTSDLIELIAKIGFSPDDAVGLYSNGGWSLREHELEVDPYDFLVQAEESFEQGGDAADLNAISNAKRAIESQIDQALLTFGYSVSRWKTPRKLEALRKLGLAAPRILKKVADARNLLEHEYRRPKKHEIEEALDLAALFIGAIKPVLNKIPYCFIVGNEAKRVDEQDNFSECLVFDMQERSVFNVAAWTKHGPAKDASGIQFGFGNLVGETTLDWKDDDLFPVSVQLALALERDFRVQIALEGFCAAIKRVS